MSSSGKADTQLQDALAGLRHGDFSRLAPLFDGDQSQVLVWVRSGAFDDEPAALAEALTCACFLGKTDVAESLLDQGVDPLAGSGTGMNAFHWAANRGQAAAVAMLLARGMPLEVKNIYGGTVLGTAVWSAVHEPKPDHPAIIESLIQAGASLEEVEYPMGNDAVDELLRRHGLGA